MTLELISVLVVAVFGSGGVAAVIAARTGDRTSVTGAWSDVAKRLDTDITRLQHRVEVLEAELQAAEGRNRILMSILAENRIEIPPDLFD